MNKLQSVIAVLTEAVEKIDITQYGAKGETVLKFTAVFSDIKDFRNPTRIKYDFNNILCLIFMAIMRSDKSISCLGIHDHIVVCQDEYKQLGLIENGQIPSHDTIRRFLMLIDPAEMETALNSHLNDILMKIAALGGSPFTHTSIDGKEVRGTGRVKTDDREALRNIQILNIYNNTTAVCVHSETIEDKTNEIPVAQELLKKMAMKKVVFTFDALHTQRETCSIIHDGKGYYVAPVKDNQRLLYEDLKSRFNPGRSKPAVFIQNDREFYFLSRPANYSCEGFKGLKTFVKMISHKKKNEPLTMYFISNLSIKKADLIMESIENRWCIENGLHKDKDGFLNEDTVVLTNRTAVLNIAVINSFAVAAAKLYAILTREEPRISKKRMKVHPEKVISFLLSILGDERLVEDIASIVKKKS